MAEEKKGTEKTIEMRLAELEDKVSKIHITEEELRAYHKVSALIAGQGLGYEGQVDQSTMGAAAVSPVINRGAIAPRILPRIVPRIVPRIINECSCGPCAGGSGGFGGDFGGFGM